MPDPLQTVQAGGLPTYGPGSSPAATPPTSTPPTASTPQAPTQAQTPPPSGLFGAQPSPAAPFQFQTYLQTAIDRLNSVNPLLQQKNLLVKHLYDSPLSPDEIKTLPQSLQQSIATGDRSEVEMQLHLMNDQIAGRTQTLNTSIDFLTRGYESSVTAAQTQYQNSVAEVEKFATLYGPKAASVMTQLYGPQKIAQMKNMGIDVNALTSQTVPTQNIEIRNGAGSVPGGTDAIVQSYVDGLKAGTVTSIAQVPAAYKNLVSVAASQQGVQTPLSDRRQVMAANGIIANYLNLPEYTLTANALPYLLKIDAASTIPGSVSDQELLDSFTKLSTAGGVITDAQVSVITGGRSLADTANVMAKKLAEGGVLSDDQRQQIIKLGHASYENLKKGYQPIYDKAVEKLQASGIPEQFWTLPDLNTLSSLAETAVAGGDSSSGETNANTTFDNLFKQYGGN